MRSPSKKSDNGKDKKTLRRSFEHKEKLYCFELRYSKRKTLEIKIDYPDVIKVAAPIGASESRVMDIVRKRSGWIEDKLRLLAEKPQPEDTSRKIENAEIYLFAGKEYIMRLIDEPKQKKPQAVLTENELLVFLPDEPKQEDIKNAIKSLYKKEGLELIRSRVGHYQNNFDRSPAGVRVKEQKKRWGSCTFKNELLFNWRIAMAPLHIIDYLVVHEMAHMIQKDHSKKYWDIVGNIMPDWKARRLWLKENGHRFYIFD